MTETLAVLVMTSLIAYHMALAAAWVVGKLEIDDSAWDDDDLPAI